jgi:hypothetical protein
MSATNLDKLPENRLSADIASMKQQLKQLRTLQISTASGVRIAGVPDDPLKIDDVVAAGGILTYNFEVFPAGNLLTNWDLYFSVYVDLPGTDYVQQYMLPDGFTLSAGQKNMIVTSWPDFGRSDDGTGHRFFHVNIRNNDSASHHVYVIGKFYGPYALQDSET